MRSLNLILSLVLVSLSPLAPLFAQDPFPTHPNPALTPGSLCADADEERYPEGIAYCRRAVESSLKKKIFENYDLELRYSTQKLPRSHFKIDHYIPLCMGGSNEPDNLWPQHQSVYVYTDQLEDLACQKMAKGVLKQADAIALIRRAKADPAREAATVIEYVKSL